MQTSITRAQKVSFLDLGPNEAIVEIDGLYPGYGVTLGNAMRRVLLSSLPGASITELKIKGANHEFTTVSGVKEDIVEILINFKKVRFKLHGDEPQFATLKISGEKEIFSKEIKTPSQLELVTPDIYIATVTDKKTEFEVEIKVEKGLGYIPVEQRKREKLEVGTVALDGIFTPIKRVNFEVENMRVGDRTDFNRLKVHIETDGSVDPKDAFMESTKILVDQFSEVIELVSSKDSPKSEDLETEDADKSSKKDDKTRISDLNVSLRTINALEKSGVVFVEDLTSKSQKELKSVKGLGEKGLKEIRKELQRLGYISEE